MTSVIHLTWAAALCLLVPAGADLQAKRGAGSDRDQGRREGADREQGTRTKRYFDAAPANRHNVKLNAMNKHGVTHYRASQVAPTKGKSFHWGDPGNLDTTARYTGASGLADNISWGWHHPNGVYNTIPVGAPLIDEDMNIYIGSDDAIRKFTVSGDLLWSYGPRGQLAAAPSLVAGGSTMRSRSMLMATYGSVSKEEAAAAEESLRPDWAADSAAANDAQSFTMIKAGDKVKVKPGLGYHMDGKEYYKGGDIGEVTKIFKQSGDDSGERVLITWQRTGHRSSAKLSSLGRRFVRMTPAASRREAYPAALVGSTTSGYVFAVDLETGEELWATEASSQIAGVKGSVNGKNGYVVAATRRCVDRYCYRYRNETNPLSPGNQRIVGLLAHDGSEAWYFEPTSPVWNFVPLYGKDGDTVMFNDIEGTTYCLELATGKLKWQHDGIMGTYTQSAAVYLPALDYVYTMGVNAYDNKYCNPFPAPGILYPCNTWTDSPGWLHALNASSGRVRWEAELPLPPSAANLGMMFSGKHTKLVVALGHNCHYGSTTALYVWDPNGDFRWKRDGPTLWTPQCAGDKEGGDIRRAMGGRATCQPGAWGTPVMDAYGDVYVGNQIGVLQRWGTPNNEPGSRTVELLSTLTTGVAFQDQAIAFAPGIMAVSTCTSLIVFEASVDAPTIPEDMLGGGAATVPWIY